MAARQQRGNNSRGRLPLAWPKIPATGTWHPFTAAGPNLRTNFGVDPTTGAVAGVPTPNPDVPENDWTCDPPVAATVKVNWVAPGAAGVLQQIADWYLNTAVQVPIDGNVTTGGILLTFGVALVPGDKIGYAGTGIQSISPFTVPKQQEVTL